MSGAHDTDFTPVYPDEQDSNTRFEHIYALYRDRIRSYFLLKINAMVADDLTQQVFMKVSENMHRFRGSAHIFTWIFKIAQNTLKNEYRRLSRQNETPLDFTQLESQSITLEFTKYVDFRIDIGAALQTLDEKNQEIIALRFFADCTLPEIASIVGMRESAVKNRLYRALGKLKHELNEWGNMAIMSIEQLISIENKGSSEHSVNRLKKANHDLFTQLSGNVERLATKYNYQPKRKVIIEMYPDLPTFHRAVGEVDAPNWFTGTYEENILKIVSPLNPGPEHTYESIIKGTVHLFSMWLIEEINPLAPKWIRQGIGGYEAKLMTPYFLENSTKEAIRTNSIPTFAQLDDDTWDFETKKGFQFSYMFVEFVIEKYGLEAMNQLIRQPQDLKGILGCSETEFRQKLVNYLNQLF
ncbi:RNA polymerase sigma-70 factor, ECF subfamily [Paenibacillus polysaccharolyticus]|uniref:RNA polymerase sigma-70 factor, ECF subfamily n=1 Tax=Paenibacillus polysaccharolyticus TaxID=582692 RepID=A0A1G5CYM6_9BACL|nr:sigma-70 family RNA polymerase sigma factor [Paenibacillus polysaccharolyticus]SCY07361.1 RNA polymerase sigma-70 factor, ECF subfamily [Paenibacillus polysaccharolyticus]